MNNTMKKILTKGERNTRIGIGAMVLVAAILYTSYLAHKLLHSFIDKFNPNDLSTNSLISWGGALILSGAVLFYGLSQDTESKLNKSFAVAVIMVFFDFAAYYKGLKITSYSYDSLAPAMILSVIIPFAIHFLSHDISSLLWGEEEVKQENEPLQLKESAATEPKITEPKLQVQFFRKTKPLIEDLGSSNKNMAICKNPNCMKLFDKGKTRREHCNDSCKTMACVNRKKKKGSNDIEE
jgi:hypothetical protein